MTRGLGPTSRLYPILLETCLYIFLSVIILESSPREYSLGSGVGHLVCPDQKTALTSKKGPLSIDGASLTPEFGVSSVLSVV